MNADTVAALWVAHHRGVYRYLAARTGGDPHLAEDLLQEIYLKALRTSAQLDAGRDAAPWLMTVARRVLIDHYRRSAARPSTVHEEAVAAAVAPDQVGPLLDRLVAADVLAGLPHEQAVVLLLRYGYRLTAEQAGQLAGVPAGTVKSRAHKGRARARQLAGAS